MVVLATKVYVGGDAGERALDSLDSLVGNDIGALDVEWTTGLRDDGFPSITVTGEDAPAARNVLAEEWGAITPHREEGETYVGTLDSWDEDGVVLDAGEPVRVERDDLGLGQGTPSQIRTRYGLVQHTPLRFVEEDGTARLADAERDRLYDWTRADTGRVNVNSATRAEVRATVNRAGHADDIVTVERLGLLEQSVVCKPETDPPGLLSDIGPHLPAEMLCVVP
ncbi:DUF2110 family protein [Halosegnis marinus]|uniref:DUF2110 family protein n=1 Tax=Halosegnis marinus TaxID=3034023 RepID=A0ABD5ZR21_9EURY|nr:DUF2110 family protein [Halosegnis sp. DT85]